MDKFEILKIKYDLFEILKNEIQEAKENGIDLNNNFIKECIIEKIINNKSIEKYIDKDITRIYLQKNLENIIKDITKQEEKEARQLEKDQKEIEKEKIKQQKELEKELKAEAIRKAEAKKTIIEAVKLTCILILSPFLLVAFMIISACNNKNFK